MAAHRVVAPNTRWLPDGWYSPGTEPPAEHRCSQCWTAYGKSAIPCKNEPKKATK